MAIKNLTYRNFIIVMNKIMAKGYDKTEAEKLAHNIFDEFLARPEGMSIEVRVERMLTKEESDKQNKASAPSADFFRKTWNKLMRMTKENLMYEMQRLGSTIDSVYTWSKESCADHVIWLMENLTPEQKEVVDEYIDLTDTLVSFEDGKWKISDPCDTWEYDDKMAMLDDIEYSLRQITEEAACAAFPEDNIHFYEYTEADLGCDEKVIADYNPETKTVSVLGLESRQGEGYFVYEADIECDAYAVSNKDLFCKFLLENSDKGCSAGAYASLREVFDEFGDNELVYLFRSKSWAYQMKTQKRMIKDDAIRFDPVNPSIETFSLGNGFFVDITITNDWLGNGLVRSAWLYHNSIGIKDEMFGMLVNDISRDEFIETVKGNLYDGNCYIDHYTEEYMNE